MFMNDELLSMDEIKARYADEWVLIDEFESDPVTLEVLRGKVRWHGPDREQVHEYARNLPRPFRSAVQYTGRARGNDLMLLSPFILRPIKSDSAQA
jgi:hypothetical protein